MQYRAIAIVTAILLVSSVVLVGQNAFAANLRNNSSIGQHIPSDETITINSIEFDARKTKRTDGTITIQILQGTNVLASDEISTHTIKKTNRYVKLAAQFDGTTVTGSYDILITFDGKGAIILKEKADNKNRAAGNLFEGTREDVKRDLVLRIKTTSEGGDNAAPSNPPSNNPPPVNNNPPPPENNPPPPPNTQQPPPPPPEPQTYPVTINSKNGADNSDIFGMAVQVTRNNDGSTTHGSTPMSFAAISGEAYTISVSDFGSTQFVRWLDTGDTNRVRSIAVTSATTFTAIYNVGPPSYPPPPQPPAGSDPNGITVYAYRIPSWQWGPTFASANANMYFVLYNSTGALIQTGFADENGYTFSGLESGATYYVYPTDCDGCHSSRHDVVFRHWEDSSTERPRGVVPGISVGANFEYVPWASNPS